MLVEKEDYITESLNLIGRKPVQQWQRVKQLKHWANKFLKEKKAPNLIQTSF